METKRTDDLANLRKLVAGVTAQARLEGYTHDKFHSWAKDAEFFLRLASGSHVVALFAFRELGLRDEAQERAFLSAVSAIHRDEMIMRALEASE